MQLSDWLIYAAPQVSAFRFVSGGHEVSSQLCRRAHGDGSEAVAGKKPVVMGPGKLFNRMANGTTTASDCRFSTFGFTRRVRQCVKTRMTPDRCNSCRWPGRRQPPCLAVSAVSL